MSTPSMQKATAIITRSSKDVDRIKGNIIGETDSMLLIHRPAAAGQSEVKEWFAKSSQCVNCYKEEDLITK